MQSWWCSPKSPQNHRRIPQQGSAFLRCFSLWVAEMFRGAGAPMLQLLVQPQRAINNQGWDRMSFLHLYSDRQHRPKPSPGWPRSPKPIQLNQAPISPKARDSASQYVDFPTWQPHAGPCRSWTVTNAADISPWPICSAKQPLLRFIPMAKTEGLCFASHQSSTPSPVVPHHLHPNQMTLIHHVKPAVIPRVTKELHVS